MLKFIRNTRIFAFVQGFIEMAKEPKAFGRTHPYSQDWNEAYDQGGNLAEKLFY